ncbi:MAG: CpaD family pilus assembly protein [Allosphingosinicella sp.]
MARFKSLPFLLAATAGLVAAAPSEARRDTHGPERGLDSVNQPVVQRTDFAIDLASPNGDLSTLERGRLRGWFATLGLGYGDRIFVEDPYGRSGAATDVAQVTSEFGLLLSEGAPVTPGPIPAGTVRVIVSRSTATVPGCPALDRGISASLTSPNYGCAVNTNFAAMVADPQDLVLGQAGSVTGDTTVATKAIKVYRETPPTGTKGLQESQIRGSGR